MMVLRRGLRRALYLGRRPVSTTNGWKPATLAIHGDSTKGAALGAYSHDGDVAPPLGVSTTFEGGDHVYSRDTNPTRARCEAVLGAVEGAGAAAVLFGSGLAATHAVLSALAAQSPGVITRVAVDGGYHGTHAVLGALEAVGAPVEVAPLPAPEDLRRDLGPSDVVWLGAGKGCEVGQLQTAPLSVAFHSFRLIFRRPIISRSGLERECLSLERARAERPR